MSNDLNAALRAVARANQLRFDDRGQLVPVDQIEATDAQSEPEAERFVGGSGDGGRGNDAPYESHRKEPSFNDALRRAAGY